MNDPVCWKKKEVKREKMPTKRIAIVEDDMNIRDIVESYLLKEGYETIGVDSAGIHSPLTTPDAWRWWLIAIHNQIYIQFFITAGNIYYSIITVRLHDAQEE